MSGRNLEEHRLQTLVPTNKPAGLLLVAIGEGPRADRSTRKRLQRDAIQEGVGVGFKVSGFGEDLKQLSLPAVALAHLTPKRGMTVEDLRGCVPKLLAPHFHGVLAPFESLIHAEGIAQ